MNTFTVVGRLTKDCEIKSTKTGKSFQVGCVASDVGWGDNKKTLFLNFTWWSDKMNEHLKKGKMVFITGTLEPNDYTDKEGKTVKNYQINVRDISFVGGGKKSDVGEQNHSSDPSVDDTDLPF